MRMSWILLIVALVGCSASDPSGEKDQLNNSNNISQTNNQTNQTNNQTVGESNNSTNNGTNNEFFQWPTALTTSGIRFSGPILSRETTTIKLTGTAGDFITMKFSKAQGSLWEPRIMLYQGGNTQPVTYSDPAGTGDAELPRSGSGSFEFYDTAVYDLVLENGADADGSFSFELTCTSGGCKAAEGDIDSDGKLDEVDNCPYSPNPDQADSNQNGRGDVCDGGPDPWTALSNNALEDALRETHAGHISLNYTKARDYLFSSVDNVDGFVSCVYTDTKVATTGIPDQTLMNTEHTWPQSLGGDNQAKGDLHHLFGVTPMANTQRSNLYYGIVTAPTWQEGGSKRGKNAAGDAVFEPRAPHRGNAARALFYIAIMYRNNNSTGGRIEIPDEVEALLRQWNADDPVDDNERKRNQVITNIQNNRNPFVDYPQLVDRIDNF